MTSYNGALCCASSKLEDAGNEINVLLDLQKKLDELIRSAQAFMDYVPAMLTRMRFLKRASGDYLYTRAKLETRRIDPFTEISIYQLFIRRAFFYRVSSVQSTYIGTEPQRTILRRC